MVGKTTVIAFILEQCSIPRIYLWCKLCVSAQYQSKSARNWRQTDHYYYANIIPAKPLLNHDIVSVHSNHFHCMEIYDKLSKHLSMLTNIYFNMDDCWLTSSIP